MRQRKHWKKKAEAQSLKEMESVKDTTDVDREIWPALGLIKLPLLALMQRKEE